MLYEVITYAAGIDQITLEGHLKANLTIRCSKGTYIRTLADDLGRELGYGAHAERLTRLRITSYNVCYTKLLHSGFGAEKPNFLIVIADDATYRDLPLWGGENVEMPNLDRLASEGLVFDRAYLTIAMCQPCRSEMYTGLYPVRNGACWNDSASKPGTKSICHHRITSYNVCYTKLLRRTGPDRYHGNRPPHRTR